MITITENHLLKSEADNINRNHICSLIDFSLTFRGSIHKFANLKPGLWLLEDLEREVRYKPLPFRMSKLYIKFQEP
jgi:hypothetical protein